MGKKRKSLGNKEVKARPIDRANLAMSLKDEN